MALFLCFLFFLLSSSYATASSCDDCVHQTKVSYFSKDSVLSSGACGYGSLALGFNSGYLAAGVPSLYKDGAGCGACFQMRCKNKTLCSSKGTKFILSDLKHKKKTDFVLGRKAFMAMANKDMEKDILKHVLVDVEYKWVPCEYKNKNLSLRVEESSKYPDYLAIKVLYQGGQTEILTVEYAQVGFSNLTSMSRNHSAVWYTESDAVVPKGALQFRIAAMLGYDPIWIWTENVLPANWKPGVIYDTGVRVTAIEANGCFAPGCGDKGW